MACPDGSLIFVDIATGLINRWRAETGVVSVVTLGGGPNGAAFGPDGCLYVCDNGGFSWRKTDAGLFPTHIAADNRGGAIQRVDLSTGAVDTIVTTVDGRPLSAPNDLVFDSDGGLWFTDSGHGTAQHKLHGAVYWISPDRGEVRSVIHPLGSPNGIGLSPDGGTLYVSLTLERQVLAFDVTGPGRIDPGPGLVPGRVLYGFGGRTYLDSLGVQRDGSVVVATVLENAGLAVIGPDGALRALVPVPGVIVTNVAFSPDGETAYVTVGSSGEIYALDWPAPGLTRNFPA